MYSGGNKTVLTDWIFENIAGIKVLLYYLYLQKIPQEILSALELRPKQQSIVPLHLHFVELDLTKYKKFGQVCVARPSDHFLWTCDKLKLHVPEHYMTNHTTSKRYSVSPSALVDSSDLETVDGECYLDDDSEESERCWRDSSRHAYSSNGCNSNRIFIHTTSLAES